MNMKTAAIWTIISLLCAAAIGTIALSQGETINSIWFVIAAVCSYLLGYRFYSAWICAKVLVTNEKRATPAETLEDGRDYVPTNKWIVFGHHFAAISGPGPLIGPTLAAQFGYLPGILWILIGAVIGGCVQDMVILFCSVRRSGKSLGQMAKEELGKAGGIAAFIGTMMIMVILIAVLALVVVKAIKHSSWASYTITMTIPIAIFLGVYLRFFRVGKVGEASLIGFILLVLAVLSGNWIQGTEIAAFFNRDSLPIAYSIMAYGCIAAVLPVWLLLAPRDYLSTFLKIGTIGLLAISIIIIRPDIRMPALTQFIDGSGPIFGGKIFPFVFITIACGAISGFHSLISSGTTSKMIASEAHIRMVGYGAMAMESMVAVMALIAATVLEPGVFFAINSPSGVAGIEPSTVATIITGWGFPVTVEEMDALAKAMGESTLFGRTGGAPSLAVGMAHIFGSAFGDAFLSFWYHFAIMFEAVFILTALDAGTRVARFMLQDLLGNIYEPLGRTSWYPSVILCSVAVVAGWGYFLYLGVIDPNGGINILWPLFGISNQMLAGIALSLATAVIVKSGKARYAFVTLVPLTWLAIVTTTAAYEYVTSEQTNIGKLAMAKSWQERIDGGSLSGSQLELAEKMVFNNQLVAAIAVFLVIVFWTVVISMLKTCWLHLKGNGIPSSEEGFSETQIAEAFR